MLLAACATDTQPYRYRPPVPVTVSDWQTCHARADAEARQRYDRYLEMVDLAGPFGGPFGGIGLGRRAWEERETVYEREVVECLTARGYDLRPETAPFR